MKGWHLYRQAEGSIHEVQSSASSGLVGSHGGQWHVLGKVAPYRN